ncbi:MAG: TRAP transporter permease [Rhodospirillales bacterium]|nr:TRAP transporter permease [Rhodospirillales bacterium]MSP80053.1 TRAP transporter permease [Rhodospirillales bacterium]
MPIPPPIPPTSAPPSELEFAGSQRTLEGWEKTLFYWLCAGFTAFHLIVLNVYPIDSIILRAVHLGWGSVLGFGFFAWRTGSDQSRIPWYDWLLAAASAACAGYVVLYLDELQIRAGALYTTADVVVGLAGTALVLELARRLAGIALTLIAGVFLLYAFVGPLLPGVLYHKGYTFGFIFSYMFSEYGIFGVTLEISSTFIIMFTAFAAFLTKSKAGDYFNDLAVALVGWARGGPAKVAVVSGILFGSISGSSVANVVASGSVTIPMMRRVGYDRATAGAIEATSSTGGQITPPVMGAGAFIMAEVTGIPYGTIALSAVIPCLLFYIACYAHCDLHAVRNGLRGVPRSELPPLVPLLKHMYLLAPIVVLVTAFIMGYSGFRAALLGMFAALIASWLDARYRMGPRGVVDALEMGAKDCMQLVAVCAAAGIIVGIIALTGIGGRFSSLVLAIAGQNQALAMVFTMIVVTILGMGMPTTAAYAIAAAVVAPGLIRMGIPPLVAHMFIFYYAVLSAITPPVAVASFAAASMAQADPWKTSWIAVKLGLATFIVPFMFFASPALLGQGSWPEIAQVFVGAGFGVFMLACSTEGWLNGPLNTLERVLLFAAAIAMIHPEPVSTLVGAAVALAIWGYQRWRHGPSPGDKIPSPVLAERDPDQFAAR